ncbi:MAG: NAD(P)-binding domain-containing protein, partial [Pseudomonadota bacterium]
MADVTFIGLGNMGSALARTAARAGLNTVVWNRTAEKSIAIKGANVTVAASARDAILASPVIVVCVYDYDAADEILRQEACANALQGRVLVQLTTATPRDATATYE